MGPRQVVAGYPSLETARVATDHKIMSDDPGAFLTGRLLVAMPGIGDPRFERAVILLCAHGYSSSLAVATLRVLGFGRATDVVGGFDAWAAAGLPVVPSERAAIAVRRDP